MKNAIDAIPRDASVLTCPQGYAVAYSAKPDHARGREDAYRGRKPSFTREQLDAVSGVLGKGHGVSSIAATTGLTRQTIYRIKENPAEAEAALVRWA